MKGSKYTPSSAADVPLLSSESVARSATLRTELKRFDSEELSFDCAQDGSKLHPMHSAQISAPSLVPLDLLESRETLLSQIRSINKQQGRDVSACLRPLPVKKDSLPTGSKTASSAVRQGKKSKNGFKQVESQEVRPKLNYLKTVRSADGSRFPTDMQFTTEGSTGRPGESLRHRVLSPSQQTYAELREGLKARRTTMGERMLLKSTVDSRVNAVKSRMEGKLGKELQTLNKHGIFSPLVNEVRVTTIMSVRLEKHVQFTVRDFIQQEKEKLVEERKATLLPKREPVVFTEEELKRQELDQRKNLMDLLEEKLVDKIARAERKAKDADDKKGIMRLTSEQIEAKLAKMKVESSKRQKPLMTLRNMAVLDIAQGSRRIVSHVQ